jgi:lysophospholipase L1-like esterase
MPTESFTVHLIGDSTIAEKTASERPMTGWGTPFSRRFDESVTVENHAKNGRSTNTFLEEGRWDPVVRELSGSHFVFVQFGHNDAATEKDRYTPVPEFEANLEKFVEETRDRGAKPVLLTPLTRRDFDERGVLQDTHGEYSEVTEKVARVRDAAFIDADGRSQSLLRELGPDASKDLYLHLSPDEHANYPDGLTDNTHFSEHGAGRMASLVLDGIEELDLGLAAHVVRDER